MARIVAGHGGWAIRPAGAIVHCIVAGIEILNYQRMQIEARSAIDFYMTR
jgi:hypothetical protein